MVGKKTSEAPRATTKAPEGAPSKAQKLDPQRKVESESEEEDGPSGSESSEGPVVAKGKAPISDSGSSEEVYEDEDESFHDSEDEEEESDESYEEPPKAQGRKRGRAKDSDDD